MQGVWVVHREMKAEKERGCVHSKLLDILLCTSAAQWDLGTASKINEEGDAVLGLRNLMATRDYKAQVIRSPVTILEFPIQNDALEISIICDNLRQKIE